MVDPALAASTQMGPHRCAGSGVAIVPLARLRSPRDGMTSEAGTGPRPTQGLFPTMWHSNVIAWPALGMTVAFLQFEPPYRDAE